MACQSRRQGTSADGMNWLHGRGHRPGANRGGGLIKKSAQGCVWSCGVWDASAESDAWAGDAASAGAAA